MLLRLLLALATLSLITTHSLPHNTVVTLTTNSLPNNTLVTLTTPQPKLLLNQISNITISINVTSKFDVVFNCTPSSPDILTFTGGNAVTIKAGTRNTTVSVKSGKRGGTVYITTTLTAPNNSAIVIPDFDMSVIHSRPLEIINVVLGWLYFAAWSISFYPQAVLNWRRKSVVGLSFDFLGYNFLGWVCYSTFNFCLLWVETVKREYYVSYPHGVINVQLSDFCFSFHALILTAITILQCLCYERGGQKPSPLCLTILIGFVCGMVIMLIVAVSSCISWFNYVTIFSYVKLAATLFKYSPQVYVNFKNKSTEAISIYQFLLDLTGGALSLLQMGLIAWQYDDWKTFLGDFTKFGLAALSIMYDFIFIVQHYCLYKDHVQYVELVEDRQEPLLSSDPERAEENIYSQLG